MAFVNLLIYEESGKQGVVNSPNPYQYGSVIVGARSPRPDNVVNSFENCCIIPIPKMIATNQYLGRGKGIAHACQLKKKWAVETAATQTKPAYAGFKTLDFPLVREGGLCLCSREFHSPGLKLTRMGKAFAPTRCVALFNEIGIIFALMVN